MLAYKKGDGCEVQRPECSVVATLKVFFPVCLSLGEATGYKPRFHHYSPRSSAALVLGSSALTWWPRHVPAAALGLRSAAPGAAARARPGPAPQAAHRGEWEDAALRQGWNRGDGMSAGAGGSGGEESAPEGDYKKRRLGLAAPSSLLSQ